MKVEGWLFAAGFFFFALSAVIYGVLAEEPVGTVALAFTAGLAFLVGYYLLFTARRIDARPEDSRTPRSPTVPVSWASTARTAGGRWPSASARRSPSSASCSAGGCSSSAPACGALAVIGMVFEYYRGDPAH